MGKKNNVMCDYLEKPERFADFINGSLYGGRQVISAREIEESQTVYSKAARSRDILKKAGREGSYILIGVENQDTVHYAMPFRCMEYDVLEYKKQLRKIKEEYRREQEKRKAAKRSGTINADGRTAVSVANSGAEFLSGMRKEDKLYPVTTIVFYHGEEEYDGCRSLHDMLNWKKENEIFKQFIADYKINLVTLQDLNEENFRTGIRELVGFLKRRESKEELRRYCEENESRMQDMDEDTFDTISVMINQPDFMEQKRRYRQEGENINMCKAMKDWGEELRQEGMEQGLERGMEQGMKRGFERGLETGIEALIETCRELQISKEDTKDKIIGKFKLEQAQAEEYIEKYWK